MAEEVKFEQQMKKLQDIVEKLERNDIELDESIALYEEGLKLSKQLKSQLEGFEKKIKELDQEIEDE
ncbi:MAG: exodeoxyribonuclease VII small subunit [Erysipelotrichaceae bacterium]|nr:exodeoxyribonuclease VII small subunit [Erysipelotrichaceae bacterium]